MIFIHTWCLLFILFIILFTIKIHSFLKYKKTCMIIFTHTCLVLFLYFYFFKTWLIRMGDIQPYVMFIICFFIITLNDFMFFSSLILYILFLLKSNSINLTSYLFFLFQLHLLGEITMYYILLFHPQSNLYFFDNLLLHFLFEFQILHLSHQF